MKKTACWLLILSMLLLLALPAGAAEKTPAFADAGDIRNGYAVRMLVDLGLIVGDNDGNFRPAAPITRAETAKLIACLCTDTFAQAGGAPFADTAESWARDYIAYCASRGIVGGAGGYFRPQDDVTAQELAKMLLVVTGSDGARYTGAGWSERVNADAEKYGLYHAFSGRYDLPVTRDDACLLIYNAMQRPAVDGENADGTPRYVLDALMNKRTYLEVRFDAVRYTAVLTGNEYADLTQAGGKLAAGTTKLEGHKEFSVTSGLWLVGHSVDLYLRDGEVIGAPDANGDGKCDDCGATVSLTIKWDAGTNGGTIDGKASITTTGKPNTTATAPTSTPVKTGHAFKGWYTSASGGSLYNTVTITAAKTFYAQFTANTYTVTWNLGDGRSETTEQTYAEKLILPADPERKNAEFLGWFTEKDGGTEVTANTVFKETAATTYYAHWEITELFSVTVPATLPLVVDESGKVYVASASIVNNSTGDVMVSSVSVTSKNGWEFVPYSTNMAKAKVDAKQVGFKINSSETSKAGDSEVFTLAAPWTVKEADALSINYDAVVSAVSQPVTGQEIMSVVFVLEWA